jgi:hypothetical protein
MSEPPALFFSWSGNNEKIYEIKAIIKAACENLNIKYDESTLGESGSPVIDAVIERKLKNAYCSIFDITPVTTIEKNGSKEHLPNSNVLIEYGIARGSIGSERCILLHTSEEKLNLPFDLRNNRHSRLNIVNGGKNQGAIKFVQKCIEAIKETRSSSCKKELIDILNRISDQNEKFKNTYYSLLDKAVTALFNRNINMVDKYGNLTQKDFNLLSFDYIPVTMRHKITKYFEKYKDIINISIEESGNTFNCSMCKITISMN